MNKNKLKAMLAEHGDNFGILAKKLHITPAMLSKRVNEKTSAGFTQPEITQIKNLYNLSPEEVVSIFFND